MAQFNYSVQQDMPTLGAPTNYCSTLSTSATAAATTAIVIGPFATAGTTTVQPVRGLLRVRATCLAAAPTVALSVVATLSSSSGPQAVIATIPASVALSTTTQPTLLDYLIPVQTDNTNGIYSITVSVTLSGASGTATVDCEFAGNP